MAVGYAVVTWVEDDRHAGDVGARVRAAALMIETSEQSRHDERGRGRSEGSTGSPRRRRVPWVANNLVEHRQS